MGFKDGTRNIDADDETSWAEHVWIGEEEPQRWMRGGSYLVSRKIRMRMEQWDRDRARRPAGRLRPLQGQRRAADRPPRVRHPRLRAPRPRGAHVIPDDAHIRLAAPENNKGLRILRRGYSYTDGIDKTTGDLLAPGCSSSRS